MLRRYTLYFAGFITVVLSVALIWSAIPLPSSEGRPDPAVVFENQRSISGPVISEAYFKHNNLNLHYIETGMADAETIVFVHGFPSYWYSFVRQIESLKSEYHIIAIDGLGAGRSDTPSDVSAYTLENMTQHVNALLQHLDISRVHLVGHDWGAAFVFGFAQQYPEHVLSVTGISAPPQNVMLDLLATSKKQQETSGYVEKLKGANPILLTLLRASKRVYDGAYSPLVQAGKLSSEEGELFREATSNAKRTNAHINWYRANLPAFDEIQDSDYWPSRESKLTMPALIVWGNDDNVFDVEFIELLQQSSRELTVLKLDNVGHWPHVEEAKTVNTAIRRLLNGANL